jgi:hypothetical protein
MVEVNFSSFESAKSIRLSGSEFRTVFRGRPPRFLFFQARYPQLGQRGYRGVGIPSGVASRGNLPDSPRGVVEILELVPSNSRRNTTGIDSGGSE